MKTPAIENLGVLARITHDRAIGIESIYAENCIRLATRYEKAQQEMQDWNPYPHAMTLDPGPNTSELPPVLPKAAWTGAGVALVGEIALVAIVWLGVYLWRLL